MNLQSGENSLCTTCFVPDLQPECLVKPPIVTINYKPGYNEKNRSRSYFPEDYCAVAVLSRIPVLLSKAAASPSRHTSQYTMKNARCHVDPQSFPLGLHGGLRSNRTWAALCLLNPPLHRRWHQCPLHVEPHHFLRSGLGENALLSRNPSCSFCGV